MLTIKIRFTSGEIKELNEVPKDSTILQVKSLLLQRKLCDTEPEQQRLIFKGRILANEQTLAETNVQEGGTLHFVKSSSKPAAAAATAVPAPAPPVATPAPAAVSDFSSLFGGGGAGGDAQNRMAMEMLQSNPAIRNMMDRNPELARMLNSPELLQQMMQMNNPAMRDEILRNHDRQLANLESIPGGQAALLRMMNEVGEMDGMFDQTPSQPTVTRPNTTPAANSTPEAAPMPNPWSAAPARPPPTAASNNPWAPAAATQRAPPPFRMPTMGSGDMPDMQMLQGIMQTPGMRERMQEMMRNPEQAQQQMQLMQQLMGNESIAALQQSMLQMMRQPGAMEQVQQSMQRLMGSNLGSALENNLAELEALVSQGGFLGAPGAVNNNQAPETRFADQLLQLEGMGFTDRAKNVRALIATNGNVHAAVERLLM